MCPQHRKRLWRCSVSSLRSLNNVCFPLVLWLCPVKNGAIVPGRGRYLIILTRLLYRVARRWNHLTLDNYTLRHELIKAFVRRILKAVPVALHCYAALGIINGS